MPGIKRRKLGAPASAQLARVFCALDATLADDLPEKDAPVTTTVWVEVTCEGEYKGYPGGGFKFDKAVFDQLITNFRAHPSFRLDATTNEGNADVVPWDFNHASEYPATEGSLPYGGAPAQGWIQDLKTQTDENGKLGLFAKTRWLEPARSYIKNGQYKWASVTVIFDARDPVSGNKVGCVLTSVALTNTPFVEGMQELVAASKGAAAPRAQLGAYVGNMYCEAASGPEDAFEKLRSLFALPATAAASDVIGQIMRMREWSISGGAPLGIDINELVGAIRLILNLPALSTTEEIFAEADKLLGRILEEQANRDAASAAPASPTPNPPPAAPAPMSRVGDPMSFKLIASKLGVQENQAACEEAVNKLVELRGVLCTKLGLAIIAGDAVLLEAAAGAADVRGKLGAILAALGLKPEEADAAIDKIASQMEGAAKLKEVMPELEGLKAKVKEQEAKDEVAEVDAALTSRGMVGNDDMKAAFTALHKQDPAAFRTKYLSGKPVAASAGTPLGSAAAVVASTTVAASGKGAEHRVTVDASGNLLLSKAPTAATSDDPNVKTINLSGYSGVNPVDRTIAYLRAQPENKGLNYDQLFMAAMKLRRDPAFKLVDAAA